MTDYDADILVWSKRQVDLRRNIVDSTGRYVADAAQPLLRLAKGLPIADVRAANPVLPLHPPTRSG